MPLSYITGASSLILLRTWLPSDLCLTVAESKLNAFNANAAARYLSMTSPLIEADLIPQPSEGTMLRHYRRAAPVAIAFLISITTDKLRVLSGNIRPGCIVFAA